MSRASGIEHLKPFFPGLEGVLEDPEVSELMINGPHNVWVEKAGRLYPHEAPSLDVAALQRAAIHIARPLGLDPAARPIIDARLADGFRVAICVPTGQPAGGHYGAALRGTCVFGPGPGRNRLAAGARLAKRPRGTCLSAKHLGIRRNRLGQDHLAQRLNRTPSRKRTHRGHRGYPGVTDRPGQLSPLRGGALGGEPHHHPGAGPARTAAPARSHRGGRGARRRGRRSSAGPQYWSRWVANHRAFQQCRVG